MIRRPFTVKSGAQACPGCGNTTDFIANSQQVAEDCCDIWISCGTCKLEPTGEYRREDVWGTIDRSSIAVLLTDWNQWVIDSKKTTMIQRTMTLQVATKLIFEDYPDSNPPTVRVYNDMHQFKWWITTEEVSPDDIPSEVLFHARQFLYDNHPELGPQPSTEELRKKHPGRMASSPSTQR